MRTYREKVTVITGAKPKNTDFLYKLAVKQPEGNFFFITKNSSNRVIISNSDRPQIVQLPAHTFLYWVSAV